MKQYVKPELSMIEFSDDLLTITSGGEQIYESYDIEYEWDDIFT